MDPPTRQRRAARIARADLSPEEEKPSEDSLSWLEGLAANHAVEGIIFGCTELHLLHRPLAHSLGKILGGRIVDPLLIAARDIKILNER
ncbi:MAG TPA: hypothetical protein VGS07_25745 [Thermoanaerobaculia bacterium]|nr:hypothetical protein [Thermoanaerobaculia bacterium]